MCTRGSYCGFVGLWSDWLPWAWHGTPTFLYIFYTSIKNCARPLFEAPSQLYAYTVKRLKHQGPSPGAYVQYAKASLGCRDGGRDGVWPGASSCPRAGCPPPPPPAHHTKTPPCPPCALSPLILYSPLPTCNGTLIIGRAHALLNIPTYSRVSYTCS